MVTKFERFQSLAEQSITGSKDPSDWNWHSFIHFQSILLKDGILRHRPPTNHHLRELTRLALGLPFNAPRSVAARWAKRTAGILRQELLDIPASNHPSSCQNDAA